MAFWDRKMEKWISNSLEKLGVYNYEIEYTGGGDSWSIYLDNASQDLADALRDELMQYFIANSWYEPYVFYEQYMPNQIDIIIGDAG